MKDPLLKMYNELVKEQWGNFLKVQIEQIPKEKNARVDELSRLDPSDPKTTVRILVELLNRPNTAKELAVMAIDALDWRSSIIEYLKSPMADIDSS